jgi:RNA-directed DNA polymerase
MTVWRASRMCGPRDRFLEDLRELLAKFGLTLDPDKARLIKFRLPRVGAEARAGAGQTGDIRFLGAYSLCGTDLQGKFQVVRLTAKKRI